MLKRSAVLGTPLLFGLYLTGLSTAHAHGVNGHIWVSDSGIELMQECEPANWLITEGIREKLQIGAAFPDTGYALDLGRDWTEESHWEPFVQAYIEQLQETFGPPYDSLEARERIAFLFGIAGHGLEDEVFDTIFMRLAEEIEGSSESLLDPGTDFMLVSEQHTQLKPDIWIPYEFLESVYARPEIDIEAPREQMNAGMFLVRNTVIQLVGAKGGLDELHRPLLPWTAKHYLDPDTPGSFPYETEAAGAYFDVLWRRLHRNFRVEDVVIHTFPAPGRRLLSNDHTSVQSRAGLVFGYGVHNASLNPSTVVVEDAEGNSFAVDIAYTRWGSAAPGDVGRILELRPQQDLAPDTEYTIVLKPGVMLVDGSELAEELRFTFRSACEPGGICPELQGEKAELAVCIAETPVQQTPTALRPKGSGCRSGEGSLFTGLLIMSPLILRLLRRRA